MKIILSNKKKRLEIHWSTHAGRLLCTFRRPQQQKWSPW